MAQIDPLPASSSKPLPVPGQGDPIPAWPSWVVKHLLRITLDRLKDPFPGMPYNVIAPYYDAGKLDEYGAICSHDDSPLQRMLHMTANLPDDAIILHMKAHHSLFIPEILTTPP